MAVPIYVWNGTAWESTGPTIPANPIKYQASAPSSPSTGDIWVDSDGDVTTGSQQFQRFRFVASGGETTISGADANGAVLAYTAGLEQVVLNGAVLVRGHDYTATNGTSITGLSPALVANDVLEVFSFIAFTVANTYTQSQTDGLVSAAPGVKLIVPSSAVNGTVSATGAVTFSSVSTVSLNDVFSATYDNYRMFFTLSGCSADASVFIRLRASGSDSSASYNFINPLYDTSGGASFGQGAADSGMFTYRIDGGNNNSSYFCDLSISNPFLSQFTNFVGVGVGRDSGGLTEGGSIAGTHTIASSYTGITAYPSSGTFTGTIRIYGLKN